MSNITAAVLNPRRNPCGHAIVLSLLEEHAKHAPEAARRFSASKPSQVFVRRETRGDSSRVDLRIWTKGARDGDVVVDFEFKVGWGNETLHPKGESQTQREWKDLQTFAKRANIASGSIVAFFVTPSGRDPVSRDFTSLARSKLHEHIRAGLADRARKLGDEEARTALDALRWLFMSPYVH